MPHAQTSSSKHPGAAGEIPSMFRRLRANPRGGMCLQVGCEDDEFTLVLADLFDHLLAVDTSPAVLETTRAAVTREGVTNVDFQLVQQARLDGVADEIADVLVECGFLEQLHRKGQLRSQLSEFARVLRQRGQAYITVPLRRRGLKGVLGPPGGVAISERQLAQALSQAGLTVHASDEGASARRAVRELFLHLERE